MLAVIYSFSRHMHQLPGQLRVLMVLKHLYPGVVFLNRLAASGTSRFLPVQVLVIQAHIHAISLTTDMASSVPQVATTRPNTLKHAGVRTSFALSVFVPQ